MKISGLKSWRYTPSLAHPLVHSLNFSNAVEFLIFVQALIGSDSEDA